MKHVNLLLLLALVVIPTVSASLGVDLAGTAYISTWKCLASSGFDYAIIRAYQSLGRPDPIAPHTIYNARDGGISDIDVYIFPCPTCGTSGQAQVQSMLSYLAQYNATFNRIWLDIEGTQYWRTQSENQAFIKELAAGAAASGHPWGIYSSASQWIPLFGSSFAPFGNVPLWYAHYDGNPSFSDFEPFGGWSKPYMKQYAGDATRCSADVDLNYRPGSTPSNGSAVQCNYVQFKQCNPKWGSRPLGTSTTETICSAGCAMSSVSMLLNSRGITIDGAAANPGTLDSWLVKNGGYVDKDLIVWNMVHWLGAISMLEDVSSMSGDTLRGYVKSCKHGVIVNVREGTHWVLIDGYDSDNDVFLVRDPGFDTPSYALSGMSHFVVYQFQ